jgi:TonB family protein
VRAAKYAEELRRAHNTEEEVRRRAAEAAVSANAPREIEDISAEENAVQANFRPPQPFRRLHPVYTVEAARAEAEATVDALVEIDAAGEVRDVEIVRWAGFGLDEATVNTIRQLHFRPAMRDGHPIPVRFLLRYNFRRPPKNENR